MEQYNTITKSGIAIENLVIQPKSGGFLVSVYFEKKEEDRSEAPEGMPSFMSGLFHCSESSAKREFVCKSNDELLSLVSYFLGGEDN